MYFVNVSKGMAYRRYFNIFGRVALKKFLVFLDRDGVYIKEKRNKIYLTEKNCVSV